MENKLPDTSIAAWRSVDGKMLADHYQKILNGLKVLKLATYEELAQQVGFTDKNQVSRRLKELEVLEMVYKPGTKKNTTSGRQAYQYSLRSESTVVVPPERFDNSEMKTADYASVLIAGTKKQKLIQKELWESA